MKITIKITEMVERHVYSIIPQYNFRIYCDYMWQSRCLIDYRFELEKSAYGNKRLKKYENY